MKYNSLSYYHTIILLIVDNITASLLSMFTLTTSVGQWSGQCITLLAKMSVDPIFIELTAVDVLKSFFLNDYTSAVGA